MSFKQRVNRSRHIGSVGAGIDVFGTIAPTTAALQCMDNAGEHPPIIDPGHTARILRQKRRNPRPLLIRNQKKSAIHRASSLEAVESQPGAAVNPVYGSGP
jgi:hypothetical protein